jgi:protocatechuate 3,4-dioxygenase beta subunit
MRPLLVIPPLFVIQLLLAANLHAQPASAAGVVADQTGKPLAGVHIRLITGDFDAENGIQAIYGATTDTAGQFSFDGLKAGLYLVMAERAGFVQAGSSPMGIGMLPLKPGQHLTDYKIGMTARAVIAGKVVDEYGDPVQGVNLQVEPVPPGHDVNMFG